MATWRAAQRQAAVQFCLLERTSSSSQNNVPVKQAKELSQYEAEKGILAVLWELTARTWLA